MVSKIEWPELDFAKVNETTVDKLLDATIEALKQQLEGARAIYTRSGSVLNQAISLAIISFGAAAVGGKAASTLATWAATPWVTAGLLTAAVVWVIAAITASLGMRSMRFASVSPSLDMLFDKDLYYATSVELRTYLLKIQISSLKNSFEGARWNRSLLNASILMLATAPAAGGAAAGLIWWLSS